MDDTFFRLLLNPSVKSDIKIDRPKDPDAELSAGGGE
jgi:hypothetical protein